MADGELKKELMAVKGGKTRYFGFIKAGKTKLHGFAVTPRRIAGAVVLELQKESGNPAKPVQGTVRFDPVAGMMLFEMNGSPPGWLKSALKEAATQQSASLGPYDVRSYPEGQPPPAVEGAAPGAAAAVPPPVAAAAPAPPPPPPPPPAPAAAPAPPAGDAAALAQAFKARMARVTPGISQVIAAKTPRVAQVQALSGAIREAVGRKDVAAALGVLDQLEPLVQAELNGSAAPAAAAPPPAADPGKNVVFTQARLAWDAARKKAHAEIERLKAAIKDTYAEEEDYGEVVASLGRLDDVLTNLDNRLCDKLDEALNAAAPADRQRCHREAQALLQQYKTYLTGDPLPLALDDNPFTPLTAHKTLLTTVTVLEKKLV